MSGTRGPMWRIDVAGAAVCALVLSGWYGLGVRPLASADAARASVVEEIAAREERSEAVARTARTVEAQADAVRGKQPVRLVPVEQMNRRVASLNEAASRGSLRLDELKPGSPTPGVRHSSVPIVLSGSGTYAAAAAFLHQLRTEFPDVGVSGFELRADAADARSARFVFNLVWYAAPGASPAAK
ncbi:MAG: hypothetical protein JNM80_07470 [Phycisphaerae bacterium]|nr:hypothetical protein [Phycisphaerae bacterium]